MPEPDIYLSPSGGDYLSRWKRIVLIDQRLRADDYPTKRALAELCGVTTKTIQRDIEAMRVETGAPISYDAKRRGYHYTDKRFAVPAAALGERDLFALMVAENAVAQYEGTPLHAYLREAFDKVLMLLDGELRQAHELARRAIHFGGMPPPRIDPESWTQLCRCIEQTRVIEVDYRKGGDAEAGTRRLHPYQLLVRDRDWFLVAHQPDSGRELLFYLPRVEAVRPTDELFEPRAGFEATRFHRDGFNAMQGPGDPQPVELRFTPEAAYLADERAWSPDQTLRRHKDGSVTLRFESAALFEIERQVMRYGGRVEVEKPAALRQAVAATALFIAARHQ